MSSIKHIQHGQKIIPKGLTNQLQMIRRDQEIQNKQKKQPSVAAAQAYEDDKLESDKIISPYISAPKTTTVARKDYDLDSEDRWQKVGSEKVRKTIRKDEQNGQGNRWVKNGGKEQSIVQSSERRKICIVKDQNGKRTFKDLNNNNSNTGGETSQQSVDLINSNQQQNKSSSLKINQKHENQQQTQKYKEYEQSDDNKRRDRDFDEENENESYQQDEEEVDSLEQEMNHQRQSCGFIEVTNLPRQIDSAYLKDLLKKEKNNILDSLKRDHSTGYVKFSTIEAAQRAILILNKRKLFNHEISAHLIEEDEFQIASGEDKEIKPSQKSGGGGVLQRIQLKPIRKQ